jgi:hypothetical protein
MPYLLLFFLLTFNFNLSAKQNLRKDKNLNKLIECSANLIESQFAEGQSIFTGLEFMDKIIKTQNKQSPNYRALKQECKATLDYYQQLCKKKLIIQTPIKAREQKMHMQLVKQKYSDSPGIILIAQKAKNPNWDCRKSSELEIKVGIILSLSGGWSNYKCTSSLGRRVFVAAPSLGFGKGFGGNLDIGLPFNRSFYLPLHSFHKGLKSETTISAALGVGDCEASSLTFNNTSAGISLGIGVHKNQKRSWQLIKKRKANFQKSNLYQYLGI